ncbi:MAG TPA: amidase family protein, partial [Thermoanaerobaculaceae bacterium]|nr:amidase family protein [Thermoanaerobaculaceae bacterium]
MSRRDRRGQQKGMNRRELLRAGVAGGIAVAAATGAGVGATTEAPASSAVPAFEFEEATVAELQAAMRSGKQTARSLAEAYLARIEAADQHGPALGSVIEVNPEALAIAEALDAERKAGADRGPLHGIPVLIKDNIATKDRMLTTA